MGIQPSLLEEVVRRILSVATPDRIILFGSAARDRMTPESDIDLLVLEKSPANVWEEMERLRGALRGLGHWFEVFVMPTEHFEESKNVIGGLAYPANKYGKVIYEAA